MLRLANNDITDITDLLDLTNLTDLELQNNSITKCAPLRKLRSLTRLKITGNDDLTDAYLLKHLENAGASVDITIPDPPLEALRLLPLLYTEDPDRWQLYWKLYAKPDTDEWIKTYTVYGDFWIYFLGVSDIQDQNRVKYSTMTVPNYVNINNLDKYGNNDEYIDDYSHATEELIGFEKSDIKLTNNTANATIPSFESHTPSHLNNPSIFKIKVSVTTAGSVTITVPIDAATNEDGYGNFASMAYTVTYTPYSNMDVNEDGSVDKDDMTLVLADIGKDTPTTARADVNKDGSVTVADLQLVIDNLDDPTNATAPAITDKPVVFNAERLQAELKRVGTDPRYAEAIAYIQQLLNIERPATTRLLANYPNPFNPETWIPYQLAKASNVQITIYDVRGTVVRSLKLGHKPEGYYTNRSRAAHWDGRNNFGERVATGVYFYQLQADSMSLLRKMVILK